MNYVHTTNDIYSVINENHTAKILRAKPRTILAIDAVSHIPTTSTGNTDPLPTKAVNTDQDFNNNDAHSEHQRG